MPISYTSIAKTNANCHHIITRYCCLNAISFSDFYIEPITLVSLNGRAARHLKEDDQMLKFVEVNSMSIQKRFMSIHGLIFTSFVTSQSPKALPL